MISCSLQVFIVTALASVSCPAFAYDPPTKFLAHEGASVLSHSIDNGDSYATAKELYFEQSMDHFAPSPGLYQQRYFLSDEHYNSRVGGPMFFYLGNEADVTLYGK